MSIVTTVVYVASNITKIVLLLLGYNVIAIHIGYFIISLLQMIFYYMYMRKGYSWLNLKADPNYEALNQSKAVFVQQIMWMICSNTDILVLTYVAKDLKAVSVYAVYLMIYSAIEKLFFNIVWELPLSIGTKNTIQIKLDICRFIVFMKALVCMAHLRYIRRHLF